jgi:hypothetical protein
MAGDLGMMKKCTCTKPEAAVHQPFRQVGTT